MTTDQANAPKAEPLPQRSALSIEIDDAFHRMAGAATPESKMVWAKRYVDAKKRRGDYKAVVQGEVSEELIDALARHEAMASVRNIEGERHD